MDTLALDTFCLICLWKSPCCLVGPYFRAHSWACGRMRVMSLHTSVSREMSLGVRRPDVEGAPVRTGVLERPPQVRGGEVGGMQPPPGLSWALLFLFFLLKFFSFVIFA